jgi:hypothetical protein
MKNLFWILICSAFIFSGYVGEDTGTSDSHFEKFISAGPLTAEELGKYLPDSLDGYPVASEIGHFSRNIGAEKYIDVYRQYRKKEGDTEYIQITLSDYGNAPELYSSKAYLWDDEGAYESPLVLFTIIQIESENAREKESKTTNLKDIIMGVNNRFILMIEGNAENFDLFTKSLAPIVTELKSVK